MNVKRMRRIELMTALLVLMTGPLALMRSAQDSPPAASPALIGKGGGTGSGFAADGAGKTHP